jgi:hypothetical protein
MLLVAGFFADCADALAADLFEVAPFADLRLCEVLSLLAAAAEALCRVRERLAFAGAFSRSAPECLVVLPLGFALLLPASIETGSLFLIGCCHS